MHSNQSKTKRRRETANDGRSTLHSAEQMMMMGLTIIVKGEGVGRWRSMRCAETRRMQVVQSFNLGQDERKVVAILWLGVLRWTLGLALASWDSLGASNKRGWCEM